MHDCFDYCRKHDATLVVYSMSRLSRKAWEGLRFLEQEIQRGKMKLVVIDNPHLDHNTIGLLSAVAEMERSRIRTNTKQALGRIKKTIEEQGSYTSKAGRTITKLGVHDGLEAAGKRGNAANRQKADIRAGQIWPILEKMVDEGLSFREMAKRLNDMDVAPPSRRRNPDLSKRTLWHAPSVRNYVKRMKLGAK